MRRSSQMTPKLIPLCALAVAISIALMAARYNDRYPNRYGCLPENILQFESCINRAFPEGSSVHDLEAYLLGLGFNEIDDSTKLYRDFSWKQNTLFSNDSSFSVSELHDQVRVDSTGRVLGQKIYHI
ncbi:hypothetical protein [Bradyrhizobium japonicum]|uniref:hypothetical protein n=1 Tax=Bradyrhizobium japonicum TaxID=375 RepID=UPI00271518DD|nr:hypothetical protein [Bradyrhizobium japonicum]WLB18869.1 hypothetical protein QIH95_44255 [Bradyrhizobium japonicum]